MANKFRTVYNSPYNTGFDANSFRRVAAQDPQFALGEIIGSALAGAYANNYNNRGINKAVDKALAEYGTDQQGKNNAECPDSPDFVPGHIALPYDVEERFFCLTVHDAVPLPPADLS